MVTPTNRIERVIDGKQLAFTNIRDAIRFGEGEVQKASAGKKEPGQNQAKSEKSVTLATPEGSVTLSESQLQQLLDQIQKEEGELCFTELAGDIEVMEEKPAPETRSAALASAPPARVEAAKSLAAKGVKVKGVVIKAAPDKDKKARPGKKAIKAAKTKDKARTAFPVKGRSAGRGLAAAEAGRAPAATGGPDEKAGKYDHIVKSISLHLQNGTRPEDIAVYGYSKTEIKEISGQLAKAGIPSEIVTMVPAEREYTDARPVSARTPEAERETVHAKAGPAVSTITRSPEQAEEGPVIRDTAPAGKETVLRNTEPAEKEAPAGTRNGRNVQGSPLRGEPVQTGGHTIKTAGSTQTPVQRDNKEPAALSSPKRQDGMPRQAETGYRREEGPAGRKALVKEEKEKAAAEKTRSRKPAGITTAEKNGYVRKNLNDAEAHARGMAAARRVMMAAAVLSLNTGRDTSFVGKDDRKLVFKQEMAADETGKEQPVVKGYIDGQEVNDRQATEFLNETIRMMPPAQAASMQRIVETALQRQQMGLSISREELKAGHTAERAVKAHAGGSSAAR